MQDLDLLVALLANRGLMLLKLGRHAEALADSAAVLVLRPTHGKAWGRYAEALVGLGLVDLGRCALASGEVVMGNSIRRKTDSNRADCPSGRAVEV